ncbi:anti-sigma regulatory factor [Dyadobacter sp. CY345]|uniref:anti-sigma regulatory factor n=1 Tax=Dyadobacter sp. CY345 TaxID=2909335 RepID=UPI001F34F611|nr:anti-sigma regulatory factor [Dyadobacter sp. CY345]MCF2444155.1 anti-sigma regulatory factor [Dyadobacter sp. CY345]
MKNNGYSKSFVFSNKAEDVASVVRNCVEFIEEPKDLVPVSSEILARIKWALTELLINGTKHAGTDESFLLITLIQSSLTIEKEDRGNPLKLLVNSGEKLLVWPLEDFESHQQFEVYQNGMDSLQVMVRSELSAEFVVKEVEDVEMPQLLITTSEHFGLMIIAKAAEEFRYLYDPNTKKNIFSVTFKYYE